MNRAFIRGLVCELEKHAKKAKAAQPAQQAQQPQMMMPAIPPELLAAMMGAPEPEYEEPSMLQMLAPSLGLGAAGLGIGATLGLGVPRLASRFGTPLANAKANIAARMPAMPSINPMNWFGKRAGMPFLEQDRPAKVKEIYAAIKRDHPGMPAEMKARIAARQGKPGKQKQGPPYKGALTKAAKRQEEEREDPPGALGLILKAMRRIGGDNANTIRAFRRLAANTPTNKRPY
jgi:hypothetical protein